MSLDLIIRGTGSTRSPGEHLATLAAEYGNAKVVLYGAHGPTGSAPVAFIVAAEPEALAEAIKAAGDSQILVYGDEQLLMLAQHLQPGLIWISLGSDANGVREIWRIRQQHAWLSSKKLALLIEQVPDTPAPDTERLMRLSRATRAILVATAESPAEAEANVAVAAQPAEASLPAVEAEPEPVDVKVEPEPAVAEVEPVAEAERAAETEAVAEPALDSPEPAIDAEPIIETKGADTAMETTTLSYAAEKNPSNAQEALIQRYALVKERRATATRIAQVEETLQSLLKEIFVSRFAAGPEAAAAFESLSRKLTDASSEFTHLSRTMASLEAQLAKLAWLKEELEI